MAAVGEEAEVVDADQALGNMDQKAAQELVGGITGRAYLGTSIPAYTGGATNQPATPR